MILVQFDTKKIYTQLGSKFGTLTGLIAIIVQAMYGLTTSAKLFWSKFADLIFSMGFKSSRYDRDVWMIPCPNMHEYNYTCTHVDDFKIVADSPEIYVNDIAKVLSVKSHGSWLYYLGNNFTYHDTHDIWTYSCKTYKTEAIQKS